jgi:hypothetical protein
VEPPPLHAVNNNAPAMTVLTTARNDLFFIIIPPYLNPLSTKIIVDIIHAAN